MDKLFYIPQFILRTALWGGLLGAAIGAIFPFFLSSFSYDALIVFAPFGALFGGGLGVPLGAFNGLVTGFVTAKFFSEIENETFYRMTMRGIAFVLTFLITAIAYYPVFDLIIGTSFFLIWDFAAAILAGAGAAFASKRVTNWYLGLKAIVK
jgi:hypothetical protein